MNLRCGRPFLVRLKRDITLVGLVMAGVTVASPAAFAFSSRGSVEERVELFTINDESMYNWGNQALHLKSWDNLVTYRQVISDEIYGSSRGPIQVNYYAKLFGQLDASPITNPGAAPTYSQFRFDEAYVNYQLGPHFYFMLGKRRISWGVGFFANPVDAINPLKYSLDPNYYQEGVPLFLGETTWGPLTLSGVYSREMMHDLTTKNSRLGAVASLLQSGIESKLYAFGGDAAKTMFGVSLRSLIGDFAFYGEGALRLGSERTYFDERGEPFTKGSRQWSGLLGVTYNISAVYSATVEYVYDQRGYDATEMSNYFTAMHLRPQSIAFVSGQIGSAMARQYLGVTIGAVRLNDDWDLGVRALIDSRRPVSTMAIPYVMYRLTDVFTLRIEDWLAAGEQNSEYHNSLFRNQANFYGIINF